jgi:hypothetical protein
MEFDPARQTQWIFSREFKVRQENGTSFRVKNWQSFLTHPIADLFAEWKIDRPATWIAQAIRMPPYRHQLWQQQVILFAFPALEDNSVSNHLFSRTTSTYQDKMLRFVLKARLDALALPR